MCLREMCVSLSVAVKRASGRNVSGNVLSGEQECSFAQAEDDRSSRVADLFDIFVLEQGESPHQIKTWRETRLISSHRNGEKCARLHISSESFHL